MWLRQPRIRPQALWCLCERGESRAFPAIPHLVATFLCYARRGLLSFHLCFSSFPGFLPHKPTHVFPALSQPPKQAPRGQEQAGNMKPTRRTEEQPRPGPSSPAAASSALAAVIALRHGPSCHSGLQRAVPPMPWLLSTPHLCPLHPTCLECRSSLHSSPVIESGGKHRGSGALTTRCKS